MPTTASSRPWWALITASIDGCLHSYSLFSSVNSTAQAGQSLHHRSTAPEMFNLSPTLVSSVRHLDAAVVTLSAVTQLPVLIAQTSRNDLLVYDLDDMGLVGCLGCDPASGLQPLSQLAALVEAHHAEGPHGLPSYPMTRGGGATALMGCTSPNVVVACASPTSGEEGQPRRGTVGIYPAAVLAHRLFAGVRKVLEHRAGARASGVGPGSSFGGGVGTRLGLGLDALEVFRDLPAALRRDRKLDPTQLSAVVGALGADSAGVQLAGSRHSSGRHRRPGSPGPGQDTRMLDTRKRHHRPASSGRLLTTASNPSMDSSRSRRPVSPGDGPGRPASPSGSRFAELTAANLGEVENALPVVLSQRFHPASEVVLCDMQLRHAGRSDREASLIARRQELMDLLTA